MPSSKPSYFKKIVMGVPGIILSALISYYVNELIETEHFKNFQFNFSKIELLIHDELTSFSNGLQGTKGLFVASDNKMTHSTFRKYAESRDFFMNFPGALGFGFIRPVKTKDIHSYEKKVSKEIPNFKVKNKKNSIFVNEETQMVIEYIEPIEKNKAALGFNIGSEESRREAAMTAALSGQAALTKKIELVQDDKKSAGFLFLMPIYSTAETPKTVDERRRLLVGWSYTPILLDEMLRSISEKTKIEFDLKIEDVTDSFSSIFSSEKYSESSFVYDQKLSTEVVVANRKWKVTAYHSRTATDWVQLCFSILVFLFLMAANYFVIFSYQKFKRVIAAAEKTAQLATGWRHAILDGANYSIISTDADGLIMTFNRAAEKMLGYSAEEIIGRHTPAIIHDQKEVINYAKKISKELNQNIQPGFSAFIAKARHGEVDTNEWSYIRKDGTQFPVKLSVSAIYGIDRNLIGYIGIGEDLTKQKELEKTIALQQAKMVSNSKMSSIGTMAGGLAHEINSPLNTILLKSIFIRKLVLNDAPGAEKIHSELSSIEKTAIKISNIIKSLRILSKESDNENFETTSLCKIISNVTDLNSQRFQYHSIALKVDCATDLKINCKTSALSQVMLNLINNAYDAVIELPEKWVQVEVKSENGFTQIDVTDSGQGIEPRIVEKMMEPFFSTKDVGSGSGLGLSIAKTIVEEHGGELSYRLNNGHTSFRVKIPSNGMSQNSSKAS